MSKKRLEILAWAALLLVSGSFASAQAGRGSTLGSLVPQIPGWKLTEAPRSYFPGTLYEYIDGAAESYLSYGFQELVVAEFKSETAPATLTMEIYDMASGLNAFGIYSSERFPGCRLVAVGTQGYLEEGTLNFIAGQDYVKLMSFEGGAGADAFLTRFAGEVAAKIKVGGALPPALALFPREGLVAGSEKFVLQNPLGYAFLHDGYLASYKSDGQEFELFLLAGKSEADASSMMEQYLAAEAKNQSPAQKIAPGYHLKDRYALNVYLGLKGRYVLGVMRLKDGADTVGEKYLDSLVKAAAGQP